MDNKFLNDISIKELIDKHNISKEIINKNKLILTKYINNHIDCDMKKPCKQNKKGFKSLLIYENKRFYIKFDFCIHQKKYLKENEWKKNYIFYDFDDKYLNIKQNNFKNNDFFKRNDQFNKFLKKIDKGLYIWGDSNMGKTTISLLLSNKLAKKNFKVFFCNWTNFISLLKEGSPQIYWNKIKKSQVIILDDVGSEDVSKWTRDEIMLPLLNLCVMQNKLIIINSNYSLKKLKFNYLNAKNNTNNENAKINSSKIINRIEKLCELIKIQ